MGLRTKLAEWLDPETARTARRWERLRTVYLDEARTWLGVDFPIVDEVIYWALVRDRNHWRSIDELDAHPVPSKPWIHHIHQFREYLRGKYGTDAKSRTHD